MAGHTYFLVCDSSTSFTTVPAEPTQIVVRKLDSATAGTVAPLRGGPAPR